MGFNRQREHVYFYGEDKATSDIAQGFVESMKVDDSRCQVFHEYGKGWTTVADAVEKTRMWRYPLTRLVLVIDFDHEDVGRVAKIVNEVKRTQFKDRIYVLGAEKDAQQLMRKVGSILHKKGKVYEKDVGAVLADAYSPDGDCIEGIWSAPELSHNIPELKRLCVDAGNIIFEKTA